MKTVLLFLFASVLTISASGQHNFYFTYYEVYKSKSYDSLALWNSLRRNSAFENEGTIYINQRHHSFRITLKEDSKFAEQKGILRMGENNYILSDNWFAVLGNDPQKGNYMGVYKPGMWVVYYRKKPAEASSRVAR